MGIGAIVRLGVMVVAVGFAAALIALPSPGGIGSAPVVQQSGTPTGSPTTASPTPSGSPTPSPSTSATEPAPDPNYRRVFLFASRNRVRVGRDIILSGHVAANRVECRADVPVTIERLVFGTQRRLRVTQVRTRASGEFRARETVRWSSLYYAVTPVVRGCRHRRSDPEDVHAHVWFSVKVNDSSPARDTNFRIRGRVRPSHPHTRVLLQQRRRGGWRTVQRTELSPQSSFSFFPYADWKGRRDFRIRWPKADRDHEAGSSRVFTVRTH